MSSAQQTQAAHGAIHNYPMASLYVGDLHSDVTEAQLHEKFSQAGLVLSIRVCRDMITRRSLGYAYVNFQQPDDAERALDTMNYDKIKGRPMRIMWSQRDPSLRKSGVGNVFIKNLDKAIDNKALYDTFSTFGNILSCKIVMDNNGSRGFGFIHFETEEAAQRAIDKVNGMLLNNKKVCICKFMTKRERIEYMGDKLNKFTNVYVKNLPASWDDDKLKSMFSQYGETTSVRVMKNENGESLGFGFSNMKKWEDAQKAIEALNDMEVEEKVLYCARAQRRIDRDKELKERRDKLRQERSGASPGLNLYVKNLDDGVDDEKLRSNFEEFGNITSAKVMMDNGRSRGFGFVTFSTPEEATKAITGMHGRIVSGKPLFVTLAQRKDDRKAFVNAQYITRTNNVRFPNQPMGQVLPIGINYINPMQRPFYQPQTVPMPAGAPAAAHMPSGAAGIHRAPHAGPTASYGPSRANWQQPNVQTARSLVQSSQFTNPNMQPGNRGPRHNMVTQNSVVRAAGNQRPITGTAQSGGIPSRGNMQNVRYTQMGEKQQSPNQAAMVAPQAPGPMKPPVAVVGGGGKSQGVLTLAMLADAPQKDQKQMLGERLFPLIEQMYPEQSGKITGMLLEIDNIELVHMIESHDSLRTRVEEAVAVLKSHQRQELKEIQPVAI